MAATTTVTTAVVDATMAAVDATTAKTVRQFRNRFHSQWRDPALTGAANAQVVVMAKDVAAINNLPMLHRKTLRLSSNLRRASNSPRVNKQSGKQLGHAAMAPAIVRHQPVLKINPPFSGA
jgi:hypothetical protein